MSKQRGRGVESDEGWAAVRDFFPLIVHILCMAYTTMSLLAELRAA